MNPTMKDIVAAIEGGASPAEIAALELPKTYRGLLVRRDEVSAFTAKPRCDREPAESLHVDEVPVPALAMDEVLVGVMASSINFNTVWSATFEPAPTFVFLKLLGKRGEIWRRHDLPYHVLGSDAAGVVLRTGAGVTRWKPGNRVIVHGTHVDLEGAEGHSDSMLDPSVLAWGYETNFGGLAELCVAKANQLLPKPEHLTWEEAACNGVTNSTAYRQLVSTNGANLRQGDVVLVWGAAGGLGSYALQYALNGGAYPIAVVSSPQKADIARRMGCKWVIDRQAENYRFLNGSQPNLSDMRRFRRRIHELTGGEDPRIVFEHTGRETFGVSVFVAARGGIVVTCASTTGYEHSYDNRYLWTNLKRVVGTHIANLREASDANRLLCKGAIYPTMARCCDLENAPQAVSSLAKNEHVGKTSVLCLAPREGMGVRDHQLRRENLQSIMLFRNALQEPKSTSFLVG
jgi:crotonyl-CoA reductase